MQSMATETPQFFQNRGGKRLFSVLHSSDLQSGDGRAVVFCAPLFEEKLWSHRVLVNCARHLAARGVCALRFDYFGDGESEGRFEQGSVRSRIEDINDAVQFCRDATGAEQVYALGLGYGATMALSAAAANPAIAGAVAWAPVMDGERYLGELLRAHLAAQMVVHRKVVHDRDALVKQILDGESVNVEGYEIGKALYTEMLGVDLLSSLRAAAKRTLVLQVMPAERIDPQYAAVRDLDNPLVEFDAVRELKFWTQQKFAFPKCESLFERTAAWLAR
jgi:alpha/beta superfamily hydrolase